MLKSNDRTSQPGWQITQYADAPVHLPILSVVDPALKQVTKLVIADDNPHARHGLRAILASHVGIEVIGEASQGAEAIALVTALRPDVVLLDVRMPNMDGLQAARTIKQRQPNIKVVLLSMYADYRAEAIAIGADAYLVKGCPAEELVKAIVGIQPQKEIGKE
jgi:YesN/AraC family two-component response regulator